ncbi:helix-turn-helix domain-containing protein [Priestia aryabhattai]|uniref:helix-turn-helix domain-containing protein n=1 Tax=Priestia aryabhattai TaxID=412384 RepID=UPI001C8DF909|nr:helix-turn-helix domain-containing protein [Priestia aryabhattai]MBY0062590.1 helix-turn-helix domain-containing protein [Priestia aryabhattai]
MENFINNTRQPFTVITNELLQGETIFDSASQKLCYLYLYSLKNCSSIFPSHETIAKAACCSTSTVKRILKELQKLKLLEIKNRPGHTSIYILNDYNEVVQNALGHNKLAQDELGSQPNLNYEVAQNELLKLKDKNIITKNKISSDTRAIIDKKLSEKHPDRPFEEIKNEVLNDDRLIITTNKQYESVLKYRLKNWKAHKKRSYAKRKHIIKKEIVPEWLHKRQEIQKSKSIEGTMNEKEIELEKLKLKAELNKLSIELKQMSY